jgi:peptidyl-prolyl cis-trans isomerase SurA
MTKILSCIILISFFQTVSASIKNNILVKVENEIITNYEFQNKLMTSLILSDQNITQENINLNKKKTLNFLIDLKLKRIELSRFDVKVNNRKVNDYIKTISSDKNIDETKIKFNNNNIDFKLFYEEIETQFQWQQLIYKIYSSKINIDENKIDQEINELNKREADIINVNISEIEVFLKNDISDEENIQKIKNLIITDGFEKTAITYSDSDTSINGGNLGWVNTKSLSSNIYKIINNLKIGEISDPIRKQNSFLILKLNEKKNTKAKDVDTAKLKDILIGKKKNELFELYSRSHLSKLKNTSLIEYK